LDLAVIGTTTLSSSNVTLVSRSSSKSVLNSLCGLGNALHRGIDIVADKITDETETSISSSPNLDLSLSLGGGGGHSLLLRGGGNTGLTSSRALLGGSLVRVGLSSRALVRGTKSFFGWSLGRHVVEVQVSHGRARGGEGGLDALISTTTNSGRGQHFLGASAGATTTATTSSSRGFLRGSGRRRRTSSRSSSDRLVAATSSRSNNNSSGGGGVGLAKLVLATELTVHLLVRVGFETGGLGGALQVNIEGRGEVVESAKEDLHLAAGEDLTTEGASGLTIGDGFGGHFEWMDGSPACGYYLGS
ncbi:hypothetical protein B0T13DRAFT_521715, partial [Neurospora crassa]